MDQPNIFREFSEKIQTILASPDPQVILDALRSLAEGRTAKLQDGTEIDALSGLQNQPQGQNPRESYTQTMTALLRWAIKRFPNLSRLRVKRLPDESVEEPNLWETIALLDGPKGYNQRYVGTALFDKLQTALTILLSLITTTGSIWRAFMWSVVTLQS